MVVSFGTAAKGFYIFLSNCLPQLLIINEGSPFKVAVENVRMVFAWNIYPLVGTNIVRFFSKKGEGFLFPRELSLEKLLTLQFNNNDKSKHRRILKNLHFTMKKSDVLG